MSPTPIREALRLLQAQALIDQLLRNLRPQPLHDVRHHRPAGKQAQRKPG